MPSRSQPRSDARRCSSRNRTWPSMQQCGFEQAIAVVQAAIVDGKRVRRDRRVTAIDEHARSVIALDSDAPRARSTPRALARVSSSSRSGIESATIPAPARKRSVAAVHCRANGSGCSYPCCHRGSDSRASPCTRRAPRPSSSAMISMQRTLGHPVIVPPGNTAASTAPGVTSARSGRARWRRCDARARRFRSS